MKPPSFTPRPVPMRRTLLVLLLGGCGPDQSAPSPSQWSVESSDHGIPDRYDGVAPGGGVAAGGVDTLASVSGAGVAALSEGGISATGTEPQVDSAFAPCALPASRQWEPGAVITLVDAEEYCDIVAVPVTVLKPSVDGAYPDPGNFALMTATGTFVTRTASSVTIWNSAGTPVHTFGRSGEGPGEFAARSPVNIFIDANDSLYVLDQSRRWSVFSPDHEFIRTFSHPAPGVPRWSMHVIPDGILFTGDLGAEPSRLPFHITSRDGSHVRSFGNEQSLARDRAEPWSQMSAYDGAGGFWVVPRNGVPGGMTLEYWTIEGERLVTLRRDVPWLPQTGFSTVDDPTEPRLPEYGPLHVDSEGLIWVSVVIRDPRWRPVPASERRDDRVYTELYDSRVEVIDPRSATVVASILWDGPLDPRPPLYRWFPLTRRSYTYQVDELGLGRLEIFDVHLSKR